MKDWPAFGHATPVARPVLAICPDCDQVHGSERVREDCAQQVEHRARCAVCARSWAWQHAPRTSRGPSSTSPAWIAQYGDASRVTKVTQRDARKVTRDADSVTRDAAAKAAGDALRKVAHAKRQAAYRERKRG